MDSTPKIDIHCHILPDWDDGPDTLEQSLAMCERAVQSGLETVVATPHIGREFRGRECDSPGISQAVAQLQNELAARQIPLQIVPGGEILMGTVDLFARLPADKALSYAHKGKFALIESPFAAWPDFGMQIVNLLQNKGITPILAHPERYIDVQKDPKTLEKEVLQGALLQITAGALTGEMGRANRNCALQLLKNGWVSFISSDAHNTSHALPADCVNEVKKLLGERAAHTIFVENPRKMLEGARVFPVSADTNDDEDDEAPNEAPRGFLRRLFGK